VTPSAAATEFVNLNGLNPATAVVDTCASDASLCTNPPRKLVRVTASMLVSFVFLPVIGLDSVTIHANAISEAASLDLVVVIDTSSSMAFDNADPAMRDPNQCNPVRQCHPFEEVRAAAEDLAQHLYYPYDRMALVTFATDPVDQLDLSGGTSLPVVLSALEAMRVTPLPPCPGYPPNPSGCTNTNTSGGLLMAGDQFGRFKRDEALWVVVLLSDGGANAAKDASGNPICPGSQSAADWVEPFCRDPISATRHISSDPLYDADDAARDAADWVGCPEPGQAQPASCGHVAPGGQGAVLFTIGLGNEVTDNTACDSTVWGGLTPAGQCEPDLGEKLLRYVAAAGDDGDPATDPCAQTAVGSSCGNYYYAPTGGDLFKIFETIASRIFTRLTH